MNHYLWKTELSIEKQVLGHSVRCMKNSDNLLKYFNKYSHTEQTSVITITHAYTHTHIGHRYHTYTPRPQIPRAHTYIGLRHHTHPHTHRGFRYHTHTHTHRPQVSHTVRRSSDIYFIGFVSGIFRFQFKKVNTIKENKTEVQFRVANNSIL